MRDLNPMLPMPPIPLTPTPLPRSLSGRPTGGGFSLSSLGGEGWGEEAPDAPACAGILVDQFPVQAYGEVEVKPASSPRPSPPREEREKPRHVCNAKVSQTAWQWGRDEGELGFPTQRFEVFVVKE